jgi:hypothetical protein
MKISEQTDRSITIIWSHARLNDSILDDEVQELEILK